MLAHNTYLTPIQLSELWGVSEATLRKWRWEGKGPKFVKLGAKVVYRLVDIEAYSEANVFSSTTESGGYDV